MDKTTAKAMLVAQRYTEARVQLQNAYNALNEVIHNRFISFDEEQQNLVYKVQDLFALLSKENYSEHSAIDYVRNNNVDEE